MGWEVKHFFSHPNELLILAYPENLVKIGLLIQELVKGGGLFGDEVGFESKKILLTS